MIENCLCHLGFLKLKFVTAVYFSDTFSISLPNFVEICHTVADMSQFFKYSSEM